MADTPLNRTVDELELQAWLARAEFRNPSLHDPTTRTEVNALASLRDELRVQLALGKLDARDEFEAMEKKWQALKSAADRTTHDVGETLHDLLRDIRDGYGKLRR